MSDKDSTDGRQLTVAELLARSGNSDSSKRSRRRRRSLEEGGISVAELTGDMPAVKEKPVEARHSSVPIDAPGPAGATGSDAASRPAGSAAIRRPADGGAQTATPTAQTAASAAQAPKPAEKSPKPTGQPAQPAAQTPAVDETAQLRAVPDTARPARPQQASAAGSSALSRRVDRSPSPQREQGAGAAPGAGAGAAAGAVAGAGAGVVNRPQTGTDDVADADADTGSIPRVTDDAERDAADGAGVRPEQDASGEAESDDDYLGDADYADDEEESSGGIGTVILMAVVGIVLGAVVFLGFQQLWESGLSRILVAVLALAVTGVMVAVVHALRTARDGLSMALAAVVGLLMTFGPFVPVLL